MVRLNIIHFTANAARDYLNLNVLGPLLRVGIRDQSV